MSYMYCQIQSISVSNCDCEKIMAVHPPDSDHFAGIASSPKGEEPVIMLEYAEFLFLTFNKNAISYSSAQNILTGFTTSCFHPPAV